MPCTVESASLEPKYGNKFIAGGEDMWIHVFDFHTGDEIGMCCNLICIYLIIVDRKKNIYISWSYMDVNAWPL